MAPQPRKGKGVSPQRDEQSVITVEASKPSSSRAVSPNPDIAQLIAKQITIAQDNMAKLIAEQIAVALAAQRSGRSQTPPNPDRHRPDSVIDTVEPLASRDTHFRDGPIRGTEAQELSDGLDPTFDAWKRQILARFRDDPGWYDSEERKLEYMLRRTKGDAQIHMLAGMGDELLPGTFETVQDALVTLQQALVNPQALRVAQNQFRALCISNSEAFAQFRTRFLLLAHKSHLRPEDYRDELWHKITPALGTAIAVVEAQLITYDQLADCLLSTDINIRWLTLKTAPAMSTSTARRDRNQAGQFIPTSSAHRASTLPLAWEQPYDRSTPSSSAAARSGTAALPTRRSTTPALNPAHAGDTCFNCGKVGHCSPDCPLPRAPRTKLKELQELPESDSEDNELLTDETGKDTL
jgi:hypothetical protein